MYTSHIIKVVIDRWNPYFYDIATQRARTPAVSKNFFMTHSVPYHIAQVVRNEEFFLLSVDTQLVSKSKGFINLNNDHVKNIIGFNYPLMTTSSDF